MERKRFLKSLIIGTITAPAVLEACKKTSSTLVEVLTMLPQKQFIRIHRSYIINTSGIKSIKNKKVQIQTVVLPIGDSYANQLAL